MITSGDYTIYTCEEHYVATVDLFNGVFVDSFPLKAPRICSFRWHFKAINGCEPGDDNA